MRERFLALLLLVGLLPTAALADAVIFVPGYLSYGHSFRHHGVTQPLLADGWEDGGNWVLTAHGPRPDRPPRGGVDRFYTVELPNEAPLSIQLGHLVTYVEAIARLHEGEPLTLVGHSAGGVLARYLMVSRPDLPVVRLITIASPHAGSQMAEIAAHLGETPLGALGPMLGMQRFNHALPLYRDLSPAYPGTLLDWLNRSPHPPADYISVIRLDDPFIERWSQDMNYVPALAGRSRMIASRGGHGLEYHDGLLLVRLLR